VIVFDLQCQPARHVFEAWFGSTEDYESQSHRGLVQCPLCGSQDVEKAVMAPRIPAKSNQMIEARPSDVVSGKPQEMKAMLTALAEVQRRMLEKSDYVGDRFADEARAIHLGEADARSIYGKATPAETRSLQEEGIAVAPLPLPVVPPGEEN
jgi:hypothetical protein